MPRFADLQRLSNYMFCIDSEFLIFTSFTKPYYLVGNKVTNIKTKLSPIVFINWDILNIYLIDDNYCV